MRVLAYIRYVIVNFIKRLGPMRDMFFSSKGRMNRGQFWLAFCLMSLIVFIFNSVLRKLGFESIISFYIRLFFPFISVYVFYCIYSKRLHDGGRSVAPLFKIMGLEFLFIILVMMAAGAGEYVANFAQFDRSEALDPTFLLEQQELYNARVQANRPVTDIVLLLPLLAFTLWVGLKKSEPGPNVYGPQNKGV